MKPSESTIIELDGLDAIEEIEFGIHDPRLSMQVTANMYSDREMATIRELATNAWDAHVDAGHTDPIQVTLPGQFNDKYRVVDHGTGMSLEDFRKVYTKFNYSTKHSSNETTGALGLGSKAPLAYTNSFSVTSVKDGMRLEGIVTRRPDWSIVLKVMRHMPTNEPNGTTIEVTVHNAEEFSTKARDFFQFWTPGRVLVNGKAPLHSVGDKIADGLYRATGWNNSYIVMGNVPYRIHNASYLFNDSKIRALNFVAYTDMDEGRVDFTPAREDLMYTDRTKEALRKVIADFEVKILAAAKAEIAAVTTHAEAYKAWKKWTGALGSSLFGDLTFKGDKFEDYVAVPSGTFQWHTQRSRYATESISHIRISDFPAKTLVVTGYSPQTVSSATREKMRDWMSHVGLNYTYVLFIAGTEIKSPWIDPDMYKDWEAIKAETPKRVRVPGVSANAGRVKGSWDYYTIGGREYEKSLPSTGEIYYVLHKTAKRYGIRGIMQQLGMKADASVIDVPANRLAKFKRENPKVKDFIAYAKSKVVADGPSLLSEDAKKVLSFSWEEKQLIQTLDPKRVNDPEWGTNLGLFMRRTELTKAYELNLALATSLGMQYNGVKRYEPSAELSPMRKRYPLLRELRTFNQKEEIYLYVNAAYAARKDSK